MENVTDSLKKAFYFGVGLASYAGEQAEQTITEAQGKAQALADELIRRGEVTAGEASQWMNGWLAENHPSAASAPSDPSGPEKIEILSIEDVESEVDPSDL